MVGFYIATINIIICSIVSYFIAPLVNYIGKKFKIIDIPDLRKVHTIPIVRIGGLSIFFTFLSYFIFVSFFNNSFINLNFYQSKTFFILIGSILFFLIGLHDDIYKSSPILRLFLQFLIAFWVSFNGIGITSLNFALPLYGDVNLSLPFVLKHIFNAFWIVGLTNSINWIDGIDSLAAGYCTILSFGLFFVMFFEGDYLGLVFYSILVGSTIGFLIRNFRPAYYIMGDCGSNFLGFILSSSSITFFNNQELNSININYLFIIFSLPIFDMLFVIFSRFLNNKNIFLPDRSHIHHRLLDMNLDHKYIISILYFYSFISVFLGIVYFQTY